MILPAFRRGSLDRTITALYGMIVARARSAAFYAGYGVPDTVQGRFDLIVLHLVLLLRRLGRESDAGRRIGQGLFDAFCRDLEGNLREMGVADLAVPKEMRRFGEAFYGRQAAYGAALADADERELEKALRRNIFAGAKIGTNGANRLARYVRATLRRLENQEDSALLRGEVAFLTPDSIAEAASDG